MQNRMQNEHVLHPSHCACECRPDQAGLNQKMWEDDIFEAFSEYGDIKNLHLNLDRRTGFVKGYAFIEYLGL